MTVLNVYPDHSRLSKITVFLDGETLPLTAVTRMTMTFEESDIVADSAIDASLIVWEVAGVGDPLCGIVYFDFAELGLDVGLYNATLYAYDGTHLNGQPIITKEDGNLLQFNVVGENTISLIVEDGSNVANANTYASVQMARNYASQRPVLAFPVDDNEVAKMLIQGMDYIEAQACEFQGEPTYDEQALAWPRKCVIINCQKLADNVIPKQLIGAQIQLAIAVNSGVDIFPNVSAFDYVTQETIGPITTKYADPTGIGNGDLSPQLTAVNALLSQLFESCQKQGFVLQTRRV